MHNFERSLAYSHSCADLPIWSQIYAQAFPDIVAMVDHREDGWHQRAGIDRSLVLANSKQVLIDEKVRSGSWDDILLEVWSDEQRKVAGWVCKPLLADFIAYALAETGRGYLLPVLQLQEAFRRHGERWLSEHPVVRARNKLSGREWTTTSVCLPVPTLFHAIGGCLRVTFDPIDLSNPSATDPVAAPAPTQTEIPGL